MDKKKEAAKIDPIWKIFAGITVIMLIGGGVLAFISFRASKPEEFQPSLNQEKDRAEKAQSEHSVDASN